MKKRALHFLSILMAFALMLGLGVVTATAAGTNDKPSVTQITYPNDISSINYKGSPDNGYSYINLVLSGTNLDKLSKSDFEFKMDDSIIDLDDSDEFIYYRQFHINSADNDSAVVWIVFPENELEENRQCSITVLCAEDGITDKTKTYTMDSKPESTENKFSLGVDDWKAIYSGNGCIRIRFDVSDSLDLNISPTKAKDYIFFASNTSDPYSGVVNLSDEDTVSMSDNVLSIDLANSTDNAPGYYVVLKTGTLKNSEGKILGKDEFRRYHNAYITQGAHIENMSYSIITLDNNGGNVETKIKGTGFKQEGSLSVKVFNDNTRDPIQIIDSSDISVNEEGTEAVFTFVAPSNTTDKTKSYRLIPVINGTNAITTYIGGYDVISVLPEGGSSDDVTLSSIEMQGAYDMDDDLDVFKTSTSAEQFTSKVDAVIRGTNLSSKKTQVRAIDENGVVWPMLPVFECGATIRWQNSSTYLPEKPSKNEQHIELMLPRRLGVPHEFVLQFAPDGENFLDEPTAKVIIDNRGLYDIEAIQAGMFTKDDFSVLKDVEVKYVDKNGNELAPSDHYKGYGITELYHQGIAPKEIEGYTLSGYSPSSLNSMLKQPIKHTSGEYIFDEGQWFIKDLKGQPIVYRYKRIGDADDRTNDKDGGNNQSAISVGSKVSVAGNSYVVKTVAASGKNGTVIFKKAANKKKATVPATIKSSDGKTYKVVGIASNAFKKTKVKTITVKTKNLTKASVKGSLKGSKVKTVQVKIGKKKVNKKYVKKYKKIFTKKNAGKRVKIR